ncbi:MAG: type I secretion system permease/ATPase [Phascolarctobacterium sp.]|nr:type I secretion system permease/ATPase [Phascolarctobacterium sp.]
MSFVNGIQILNTDEEKMEYLKAIVLVSQMHEKPLEASDLVARVEGLENEAWSRELLRALKDSKYKAAWKEFPKDKELKEVPMPFIAYVDGRLYVIARNNTEDILALDVAVGKPIILKCEEVKEKWDRVALLMRPKIDLKELPKQFGLDWFLPVFWKFRRYFYEVLAASFLLQIFALISPLFTQVIIDKVLVHKGLSTLDVLIAGLVFIGFFNMMLGYLRTYIFTSLTNKVDVILGAKLFAHITGLPIRYFESHRVGETIARVKELENIRSFISGSSLVLILDTAFCFVFIVAMFWYNKLLCLVALAIIPFMVLLNIIATPIYRKRIAAKFEASAENQSFLVESITGAETVKTLALEQRFVRRWEDLLGHYVKTSFDVNNTANAANSLGGFLQQISTLLILWVGARLVIAGDLSVGQLVAFQMLSGQVSGPVLRLVGVWQQFQQVRISIDRIGDILNLKTEGENRGEKAEIKEGKITFDKVSFRYNVDDPQVLKSISLSMAPGVMVGIVGPSGSGKSTFAKLLQRLYDPEEGRILVDDIDISKYSPAAYRRQIGTVLQENYLFHGTIHENIAIAKPSASKEEVERAARMSGAYDFIMKMKNGFDTLVGERGDSLSGGQRQKLAISRALLLDPRILIFDEATSALDALSEKEVLAQINRVRVGRTVLMIAHRLSAVRKADMILVMKDGHIVEHGNHQALLEKNGLYAQMYHEQEGA